MKTVLDLSFSREGFFRHTTALQNITIPLVKVHGMSERSAIDCAMDILKRFGLENDAEKKPAALSVGQQQRIAIARAVAPSPKPLLLDEPTSALNPEYTGEVLDVVGKLKSEGMNFIIVTHEMGFAGHACDKVIFLCGGKYLSTRIAVSFFEATKTVELSKFFSKLLEWKV